MTFIHPKNLPKDWLVKSFDLFNLRKVFFNDLYPSQKPSEGLIGEIV